MSSNFFQTTQHKTEKPNPFKNHKKRIRKNKKSQKNIDATFDLPDEVVIDMGREVDPEYIKPSSLIRFNICPQNPRCEMDREEPSDEPEWIQRRLANGPSIATMQKNLADYERRNKNPSARSQRPSFKKNTYRKTEFSDAQYADLITKMNNISSKVTEDPNPAFRMPTTDHAHVSIKSDRGRIQRSFNQSRTKSRVYGHNQPEMENVDSGIELKEGEHVKDPASSASNMMTFGFDAYNANQKLTADRRGIDVFQSNGGDYHPGGQPMGLSMPDEQDRAAKTKIDAIDTFSKLAGDLAGMPMLEMDPGNDAQLLEGTTPLVNETAPNVNPVQVTEPAPGWTFESRAARRWMWKMIEWNPSGLSEGFYLLDPFVANPFIAEMTRQFCYMRWKSITIGIHYKTNGFYGGLARMVYAPGFNIPNTDALRQHMAFYGIGDEFFANENTEIELEIPWTYPLSLVASGNSDIRFEFGSILLYELAPFRAPSEAKQSIAIQITFRVNGLEFSVPRAPRDAIMSRSPYNLGENDGGLDVQTEGATRSQPVERNEVHYIEPIDPIIRHKLRYIAMCLDNMTYYYEEMSDLMFNYVPENAKEQDFKDYFTNDEVKRAWVAASIAANHFLLLYGPIPLEYRSSQFNWTYWYYKIRDIIDEQGQALAYLNSWNDEHREDALTVSRTWKLNQVYLKQMKHKLKELGPGHDRCFEHPKDTEAFVKLFEILEIEDPCISTTAQTEMSNEDIFYYPTTNKMQGRYNTTRLAGGYMEKDSIRASDTSIVYLSSIWTYLDSFVWRVSEVDELYRRWFSLRRVNYPFPPNSFDWNMLTYLGSFATMWSGTFEIKIQISRSIFHEGKLLIYWRPNTEDANLANITIQDAMQFPHVIVDVSEQNEIYLKIPNTNLRSIRYLEDPTFDITSATGLGTLHIIPFSPLVGTTNVWNDIDLVVWIRGCQDGDFNQFRLFNPANVTNYNRQTNKWIVDPQVQEAPGYITLCEDVGAGPIPIGFEEIVDLKQLLSRTQSVVVEGPTPGNSSFPPIGYAGGLDFENYPLLNQRYPNVYHPLIMAAFAFWYGDMDIMVTSDADVLILRQLPSIANPAVGGNFSFGAGPGMVRFQNATTMVTAKLSPYGINNFFMNPPRMYADLNPDDQAYNYAVAPSCLVIDAYHSDTLRNAQRLLIYYSAAENFSLSSYVCIPVYDQYMSVIQKADLNAQGIMPGATSLMARSQGALSLFQRRRNTNSSVIDDGRDFDCGSPTEDDTDDPCLSNTARLEMFSPPKEFSKGFGKRPRSPSPSFSTSSFEVLTPPSSPDFMDGFEPIEETTVEDSDDEPPDADELFQFTCLRDLKVLSPGEQITYNGMKIRFHDEYNALHCKRHKTAEDNKRFETLRKTLFGTTWRVPDSYAEAYSRYRKLQDKEIFTDEDQKEYEALHEMLQEQESKNTNSTFMKDPNDMRYRIPKKRVGFIKTVREIPHDFKATLAKCTNAADKFEKIGDSLQDLVSKFTGFSIGDVNTIVIMIVDLIESIYINTKVKWGGFVTKLALSIGLRHGALETAFREVFNHFCMSPRKLEEGNTIRTEAASTPQTIAMILSIVVMALGMKTTGALKKKKNLSMWEYLAVRGREVHNIRMGFAGLFATYECINESIMYAYAKYICSDPGISISLDKQEVWKEINAVSELIKDLHEHDSIKYITYCTEKRAEFKTAYNRMNDLRHRVTILHDREIHQAYLSMRATMEDLISAAMDNSPNFSVRQDPAHYYIAGESDVGKSAISTAIAKCILKSQNLPVEGNIYSRTEASKFHDNYLHQYVYQIDDGHMIDDPETAMECIQRKSNVPYVLEMADIKKKGMYFTSRAIITTSNQKYPKAAGLKHTPALFRRRNILINARKRKDKEFEPDFSHLLFDLLDPASETSKPRATGLTFHQLMRKIMQFHGDYTANQAAFVKGIAPKMTFDKIFKYDDKVLQSLSDMNSIIDEVIADMKLGKETISEFVVEPGEFPLYENLYKPATIDVEQICISPTARTEGAGSSTIKEPKYDRSEVKIDYESHDLLQRFTVVGLLHTPTRCEAYGVLDDDVMVYFDEDDEETSLILEELSTEFDIPMLQLKKRYGPRAEVATKFCAALKMASTHALSNAKGFMTILGNKLRSFGIASIELMTVILCNENAAQRWGVTAQYDRTVKRISRVTDVFDRYTYFLMKNLSVGQRILFLLDRALACAGPYLIYTIYALCNMAAEKIGLGFAWIYKKLGVENKWLKYILTTVAFGLMFYGIYYAFTTENKSKSKKDKARNLATEEGTLRIQDHHHRDLPADGKKYTHVHLCESCNKAFTHTHAKHSYDVSKQYNHLCHKCHMKKLRKADRDKEQGKAAVVIPTTEDENFGVVVESVNQNSSPKVKSNRPVIESVNQNSSPKVKSNRVVLEQESSSSDSESSSSSDESFFSTTTSSSSSSSESSEDEKSKKKKKKLTKKKKKGSKYTSTTLAGLMAEMKAEMMAENKGRKPRTEGTSDLQTMDVASVIKSNQGRIYKGQRNLCYIGLAGRHILLPCHFTLPKQDTYTWTLMRFGQPYTIEIPDRLITRFTMKCGSYKDIALVDLSDMSEIPSFQDIRHYFTSEKDLGYISAGKAIMQFVDGDVPIAHRFSARIKVKGKISVRSDTGEVTGMPEGYIYEMATTLGDCGSPILVLNPKIQGKIIGIHVMGERFDDIGYAIKITAEDIKSWNLQLQCASAPPIEYIYGLADKLEEEDYPIYTPPGRHIIVGKIKGNTIPSPLKSDIIPSPIFDKAFPHITEPVVLTSQDPRNTSGKSPMIKALEKFDNPQYSWDYRDRIISRTYQLSKLLKATESYNGPKHVLSIKEAINGIPGFVEPLKMTTSPGYPYINNRESGTQGKLCFFNKIGETEQGSPIYMPKEELQKDIDLILRTAKDEGWCINNFYMDWLKDERRKIEKVRIAKTRMFNIHNMAWLIVMRMYYSSYIAAHRHAFVDGGSTIGINMHGPDVTRLTKYLNTVGDSFWDLDVGNFDGTAENQGITDALWTAKNWIRRFNNVGRELDVIGESIFWRIHVVGMIIYIPLIGVPSGWLMTALIDSEINTGRRNKSWLFLMRSHGKPELANLKAKENLARDTGNGDDVIGCVSDAVKHIYNPENIAAHWKQHGIDATPPTKELGRELSSFRPLNGTTYLKCTIDRHEVYNSLFVAKMDLDTITELANWIRTGADAMTMLRSNIVDMEMFLYPHGRKVYYDTLKRVQEAMHEIGSYYEPTAYEEYDSRWRSEHEIP